MDDIMQLLIDKELNSDDKILKPDFNSKTGREFLAFYLQTKFKQILAYDKRCDSPVFKEVNPTFITRFTRRLINNPSKRLLIGISGESASGKSTICKEIKNTIEQLSMPVAISPESFQLDLLKQDLEKLSQGIDIKAPRYVPNGTGVSIPESLDVSSDKIIVVEGIATMYENVKDVFDVKIYIETESDIRRERIIRRAVTERNQDEENACKHWEYLLHAGEKYVKPCRRYADFVLDGNSDLHYLDQILEYIYAVTNNFQ